MEVIKAVLTDKFLGAIFSTIFIILMGFFLRKKNIVGAESAKNLSAILLTAALPALAFNAFMVDLDPVQLSTGLNVLIFGFVSYVVLIFICLFVFARMKGDVKKLFVALSVFGSTTFFGIPIINGIFGAEGTLYANVYNIAYRIFLYSYCLILMSGLKFEKKNFKEIFLNPIIVATVLGFIIWTCQGSLPQVTLENGETAAFARIDKTIPWVFAGLSYLGSLSSPLAWLAIGMTLANISIGEALKEKRTLLYSGIKLILIPAFFLIVMIIAMGAGINFNSVAITSIVIMWATPPATVAVAYAIKFEREAVLASNLSLVGTVLAVFAIIGWLLLCSVLTATNII